MGSITQFENITCNHDWSYDGVIDDIYEGKEAIIDKRSCYKCGKTIEIIFVKVEERVIKESF